MANKKIETELLTWTRHTFPTLYYRYGSQIKIFIEGMEEKRIRKAKLQLQEYLVNIHNKQSIKINGKTI